MTLNLYFDGLCERASRQGPRNPGGLSTYGWIVYQRRDTVAQDCGVVHHGGKLSSNNVAEYTALLRGLEYLIAADLRGSLVVRGDSQLAINQINGIYQVRSPRLKPLYQQVMARVRRLDDVRFEWVPRKENEAADALSRQAYRESLEASRRKRASDLAVKPLFMSEMRYRVDGHYTVDLEKRTCECLDFRSFCKFAGVRCKHLIAAMVIAAG